MAMAIINSGTFVITTIEIPKGILTLGYYTSTDDITHIVLVYPDEHYQVLMNIKRYNDQFKVSLLDDYLLITIGHDYKLFTVFSFKDVKKYINDLILNGKITINTSKLYAAFSAIIDNTFNPIIVYEDDHLVTIESLNNDLTTFMKHSIPDSDLIGGNGEVVMTLTHEKNTHLYNVSFINPNGTINRTDEFDKVDNIVFFDGVHVAFVYLDGTYVTTFTSIYDNGEKTKIANHPVYFIQKITSKKHGLVVEASLGIIYPS